MVDPSSHFSYLSVFVLYCLVLILLVYYLIPLLVSVIILKLFIRGFSRVCVFQPNLQVNADLLKFSLGCKLRIL